MTTTVTVKARAWGATVKISSDNPSADTIEVAPNETRTFDLQPGQLLTVEHGKEPKTEGLNGEELAPVTPVTRNKPTAPAITKEVE